MTASKLWYVEIEGIAIGGCFETRADAQHFATLVGAGEIVEDEDFSAPTPEQQSAAEPQEWSPEHLPPLWTA